MRKKTVALAIVVLACGAASDAHAFCGFYVTGAEASLFEDATMVVLMRDGTRTVLSMQNDYRGPPQDFAMVVPVPTVLSEDNVRTLDRSVFAHVDQLAAPRLVEYWEQDPCRPIPRMRERRARSAGGIEYAPPVGQSASDLGVRVEAQFAVAEYDIVILSASDSSGLDTWLRREGYRIPNGAEAVLRPYVEAGTKFFVARIDVDRVTFQDGRALLSPLRVHYDTPEFNLPIRLGLLNSAGQQDLIVHILAREQRYEVANHPNALIPTNVEVRNGVRRRFGEFYNALFDRTLAQHPGAVITEYSWSASSCDPCPSPPLTPTDLATLGADVISGTGDFTLTRLHYRYTSATLGDDLVFRAATGIAGGVGVPEPNGHMDQSAQSTPYSYNSFQGRYAILHRWTGPMTCERPNRGDWGGPPHGGAHPSAQSATGLAYAPRRMELDRMVRVPVPEIGVRPRRATTTTTGTGTGGGGPPPESPHAALEPHHEGRGVALFLAGLAVTAISIRRLRG